MIPVLLACSTPVQETAAPAATDSAPPPTVTVRPWIGVADPGAVRLRVETVEDIPVTVTLSDGRAFTAESTVRTVDYAWPDEDNSLELEHHDRSGQHVVHEVLLDELSEGVDYTWEASVGGLPYSGSFALPAPGDTFRLAFVGDTMMPAQEDVLVQAAAFEADLFLHGGDLQYQSLPGDTWGGTFHDLRHVAERAPIHVALGNHEDEDFDEMNQRTLPLLGGQGEGGDRWHAFSYGGVRVIALSTEDTLNEEGAEQLVWLEAELAAAGDDIVVFFHKPIYTLANHAPRDDIRAKLHPLFVEHGVDLVLQGHNHGYERFLVDGIPYVMDGGGGAAIYDMNSQVKERPDEAPLRQFVEGSYGVSLITIAAGGELSLTRVNRDGDTVESARLR